jgi:hypothetical protein
MIIVEGLWEKVNRFQILEDKIQIRHNRIPNQLKQSSLISKRNKMMKGMRSYE